MKIILFALLICSSTCFSQSVDIQKDPETKKYLFQDVINIEGLSSDDLYDRALIWVAQNYSSANDVIQYKDQESNIIVCRGNLLTYWFAKEGRIGYTLTLEFKENRYRFTVENLSYYSSGSGEVWFNGSMMGRKALIKEANEKLTSIINSLNESLTRQYQSKSDDW